MDKEEELGGHSSVVHIVLRPLPVWGTVVPTRVRDVVRVPPRPHAFSQSPPAASVRHTRGKKHEGLVNEGRG